VVRIERQRRVEVGDSLVEALFLQLGRAEFHETQNGRHLPKGRSWRSPPHISAPWRDRSPPRGRNRASASANSPSLPASHRRKPHCSPGRLNRRSGSDAAQKASAHAGSAAGPKDENEGATDGAGKQCRWRREGLRSMKTAFRG
jgi:hypothetical protein